MPDCKKFSPLFTTSCTPQSTIPYHTVSNPLLLPSKWSLSSEPLAIHYLALVANQIDATAVPILSRNLNSILTVRDVMPLLLVLVRDAQDREVLSMPFVSHAELTLRLLNHFQQWGIQVREKLLVTY